MAAPDTLLPKPEPGYSQLCLVSSWLSASTGQPVDLWLLLTNTKPSITTASITSQAGPNSALIAELIGTLPRASVRQCVSWGTALAMNRN